MNYLLDTCVISELIKKNPDLHKWVNSDLRERFKNRIINLDLVVATKWGKIQGKAELAGKPMSLIDGLISATGIAYDLIVVTRNTKDMEQSSVSLLNPWL
jgi:predicted nucleic acid-binding protein